MYRTRYQTKMMSESAQRDVDLAGSSKQNSGETETTMESEPQYSGLATLPRSNLRPGDKITQNFTKDNATGWFRYFDQLCLRLGLNSNHEKIDALIPCLDSNEFVSIQDLLDGEHSFEEVKVCLIAKFSKSLDQSLQELLSLPSLGDLAPSKFLTQARREISKNDMSDAVLCEILMNKLPLEVQNSLSIVLGSSMDEFSKIADRAMRRHSGQGLVTSQIHQISQKVEHLESKLNYRPPSRYRSNSYHSHHQNRSGPSRYSNNYHSRWNPPSNYNRPRFCFYHRRFGRDARNCIRPCSWIMPEN